MALEPPAAALAPAPSGDPTDPSDPSDASGPSDPSDARRRGGAVALWTLWAAYGAFYFGRANLAAAVPGLQAELHFTKTQIGLILGALKLSYGVGQLVNGQLAERFSARRMLAFGMLGSAALNVVFGSSTALYFLMFVWACNGYCQALGWTPCVRVVANWVPAARRGRAMGLLGTSYQVGAALTFVASGWAAARFGWRGALYAPAGVLVAGALFTLARLREAPGDAGDGAGRGAPGRPRHTTERATRPASRGPWLTNLMITVTNPALWLLALSLAFLNACRFGFLDWGVSYLKEVHGKGIGAAAMNCAILPVGGIAGALVTGWATDRLFGGRRAPVICALLTLLGVLALVYDAVARASFAGAVALLVVIGFCIFGPQVLLVGTAPGDLARRGTAAAAAGFVDFMGYMGAFAGDQVTGFVVDHAQGGWQVAVRVWAGFAFAAALAAGGLWVVTARARPVVG